ncbi:MAG: hypothetical protein ACUVXF_01720 [Desulfobaccales bacterium]
MADKRRFVSFPLIIPWRLEFWSLPLFFPDLAVGVLWQWPPGIPYRGRPLPAAAIFDDKELRHYAPGDLTQWQAYEQYAGGTEEVDDIVRALKGEPPESKVVEKPFKEEKAWKVAWRLEVMEADQENHLARVDRGDEMLSEMLLPESWEEPAAVPKPAGEVEILDPETARLRYLLWRREMGALLGPKSVPLLLGRTSQAIFASFRQEAGAGKAPRVRFHLPGCRSEADYQAVKAAGSGWQTEFARLLEACLEAADSGENLENPAAVLAGWLKEALSSLWPPVPSFTWQLEIWGRDPQLTEGGETLLAWVGLGKGVVAF